MPAQFFPIPERARVPTLSADGLVAAALRPRHLGGAVPGDVVGGGAAGALQADAEAAVEVVLKLKLIHAFPSST